MTGPAWVRGTTDAAGAEAGREVSVVVAAAGELVVLAAAVAGFRWLRSRWVEAGELLDEIITEEGEDDGQAGLA